MLWFSDLVGAGLTGGASAQGAILGPTVDDWFIAPELALRADPEGYLWEVATGATRLPFSE